MGTKTDPFSNKYSNEQPQHAVSIQSFALGKYEVTQEQWYSLMGNNPSIFKGRTLPVENISWDEAQEFIKKLNIKTGRKYRLPSEAEWEYAARAGSKTEYSFGDDPSQLTRFAWFSGGDSGKTTHPVGEKIANNFGLYDMHGNVWEWIQDCWNNNYLGAPTDGSAWSTGDCSQRVERGGSWWFLDPQGLRSAWRHRDLTGYRDSSHGFRLARTL
jgi:formylglycine-generating enzyme required for sulfatase activity